MSIKDSDWKTLQFTKSMNAKNTDHWFNASYDDDRMSSVYTTEYTRKESIAKNVKRTNAKNRDHWIEGICFNDEQRQSVYQKEYTMKERVSSKQTKTKHQNERLTERSPQEIIKDLEGIILKHKDSVNWHKKQLKTSRQRQNEFSNAMNVQYEKSKFLKVIVLELKNELKGIKRKFNDLVAQNKENQDSQETNSELLSLRDRNEQLTKSLAVKEKAQRSNEKKLGKLLKQTLSKNELLKTKLDEKNGLIERMNTSQTAMADHLVVKLKELRSETSLSIHDLNQRLVESLKNNKALTQKLNEKCNENERLSNDINVFQRESIVSGQNFELLQDEFDKSNDDIRQHWNTISDLKESLKKNEELNKKLSKKLNDETNENESLKNKTLTLWKENNALRIKMDENEQNNLKKINNLKADKTKMSEREIEMLADWQKTKKELSVMGKNLLELEAENKRLRHFENANGLLSRELIEYKSHNEKLECSLSDNVKVKELLSGTVSSLQSAMEQRQSELDEVRKSELEYAGIAELRMEKMNELESELRDSLETIKDCKEEYKDKEDKMNKKLQKISNKRLTIVRKMKEVQQKFDKKENEYNGLKQKHLSMIERKDEIIEKLKKRQNCIRAKLNKSERISRENINGLKQRLSESMKKNKSLLREINENLDENEKIKEQIKEIGAMNKELMNSTKRMSENERKLMELKKENKAFKEEIIKLNEQRDTMQNEMDNNMDLMKVNELHNIQNNEWMAKKLKEQEEKMREMTDKWMQKEQDLKNEIVQNETEKNEKIYELQRCVKELRENNARIVSLENDIFSLQFELKQKKENAVECGTEIIDDLKQRLRKSMKLKEEWIGEKRLLQTQIENADNKNVSEIVVEQRCVDDEVAYLDEDIMRLKQVLQKKQKSEKERRREMNAVKEKLNDILQCNDHLMQRKAETS